MTMVVVDDILTDADAHVAAWVQERLGGDIVEVPFKAIGITGDRGQLVGGAYFFSYRKGDDGADIMCAVALDEGINLKRDVVKKILAYPFVQLDLPRISAEIDESNTRALAQAEALGFQVEGIKRRAGRNGGDVIVMGMLREECKLWGNAP